MRGAQLAPKSVMLTFDDGYESNYKLAFPLIKKFHAKAVIAPIVCRISDHETNWGDVHLNWNMCREMIDSGLIEFGSHTYDLHEYKSGIKKLSGEDKQSYCARVNSDLEKSIALIETELGQRVYYFAYPHGIKEPLADELIRKHFFMSVSSDSGIANLQNGFYKLRRFNIDGYARLCNILNNVK